MLGQVAERDGVEQRVAVVPKEELLLSPMYDLAEIVPEKVPSRDLGF